MSMKKFIDDCVSAHNKYRAKHGVQKVRHSKTLSAEAQKWADHLASTGKFEHSNVDVKGEKVGENIAMKWSSAGDDYTGDQVADQWYDEIHKHDFKSEPRGLGSGHFTQMVWKTTEKVGFGKAKTKENKVLVVGMYLPAGNYVGRFVENVPPPLAGGASASVPKKEKDKKEKKDTKDKKDKKDKPKSKGRRGSRSSSSSSSSSDSSRESSPESKRKTDGGSTNKTVKTTTTVENGVKITKTVTTETIVGPDGSKKTVTREHVSREGPAGSMGDMDGKFKDMKVHGGSSAASGKTVKPQKMSEFIDDAVKAHNNYRAKHGAPSLKHNKDLSKTAQEWADHLAKSGKLEHSTNTYKGDKLGENVASKWSSAGADYTGQEVVDQWYSEIEKHDFKSEPKTLGSGHFTQVVWKNSKEVGLGKALTPEGRAIVVANYHPAGNFVGRFVENVMPLKK